MFGLGLPRKEWECQKCRGVWMSDTQDTCPHCKAPKEQAEMIHNWSVPEGHIKSITVKENKHGKKNSKKR